MFKPRFQYTNELVHRIGKIRELIGRFNTRQFPHTVLAKLEKDARALSIYSSTSIEGNPLPLTDVKKILKSKPAYIRDSEREVLNYNNALVYLDTLIKSGNISAITNTFICNIQKMVTKDLIPKHAYGTYRQEPVFVNDPQKNQTTYWPPDHADVADLMEDLLNYIHSHLTIIDTLIVAGIFHQQFVIIHPFLDGNGRTARLITKALLAQLGLNTFQLFSFENYYNRNVTKYFEKVGMRGNYYDEWQQWDYTPWLEYFTDGIIDELLRVDKLLPQATSLQDRLEKHHQALLDLIHQKGVVKDSDYALITNRSRASRTLDFQKLANMKLIERRGRGRGTYYIATSN